MYRLLKQRYLIVWIAMLSVVFGALAPAISHAMTAAVPVTEEVQLCTAEGMVTIVVAKAQSGKLAPMAPDHMFEHCPYCAAHYAAVALPMVATFILPINPQATSYPRLFYRSATPLFAWTTAHPRAPPAFAL